MQGVVVGQFLQKNTNISAHHSTKLERRYSICEHAKQKHGNLVI
jgi:hypothetical protein